MFPGPREGVWTTASGSLGHTQQLSGPKGAGVCFDKQRSMRRPPEIPDRVARLA
jgi:hypothetical protein